MVYFLGWWAYEKLAREAEHVTMTTKDTEGNFDDTNNYFFYQSFSNKWNVV